MERINHKEYSDRKLGSGVEYADYATRMKISLYVYNAGLGIIPSGTGSEVLNTYFDQSKAEIEHHVKKGSYTSVKAHPRRTLSMGGGATAPKILRADFDLGLTETEKRASVMMMTGFKNNFLKLRITYDGHNRDKCEKRISAILAALAAKIRAIEENSGK